VWIDRGALLDQQACEDVGLQLDSTKIVEAQSVPAKCSPETDSPWTQGTPRDVHGIAGA
jgi:hypothetical protein